MNEWGDEPVSGANEWGDEPAAAAQPEREDSELKRLRGRQQANLAKQFYGGRDPNYLLMKTLAGAKHGFDRAALGTKGLFTDLSEADKQLLAQGSAAVDEGGAQGTVGQIAGEIAATAGPAGLVRAGAARVIPQAVKKASEALVKSGGVARVLNPATAGRAAVEGGTAAGMLAPGEGESRLGNAATGAVVGGALPLAAAAGATPAKWIAREFLPGGGREVTRAGRTLERSLGDEGFERAAQEVDRAMPSQLPLSTAAMADSPALAKLERGSRARSQGWDWETHDGKVYEKAWDDLQRATPQAGNSPRLVEKAKQLYDSETARFDKISLSQANRKKVVDTVEALKKSSQAIDDPMINKELDNLLMSVTHPEARLGVVQSAYTRLAEVSGQSKVIGAARDRLRDVLDDRTKGAFSLMNRRYGRYKDAAARSDAAAAIQNRFMTPQGQVMSGREFGVSPGRSVPEIQAKALRKAVGEEGEQAGVDLIGDRSRQGLGELETELGRHDLYRASNTPGSTALDPGGQMDVAATGRNNPIYTIPGLRGILGKVFKGINKETEKVLDDALRNPQQFLAMVAAKKALGRPLTEGEQLAHQMIMAQARGAGAATVGEQNAP
jgi:hypothetical protein